MMIPLKIYKAILLLFLVGGTATTLCAQTGCIDPWACNYAEFATSDDGSCDFSCLMGCTYGSAEFPCLGADNYDADASIDDGSCTFVLNAGCPTDINRDCQTNTSDLLLVIAAFGTNCSSPGLLPPTAAKNLGSAHGTDSVSGGESGCSHSAACNYNPEAVEDDGSCEFTSCAGCTYTIACNYDPSKWIENGTCSFDDCSGCTYADSFNYDPSALIDDGTCDLSFLTPCPTDFDSSGQTDSTDILWILGSIGTDCPEP